MRGQRNPFIYCWWEYKLVQPLWKSLWRFLKKIKIEIPYDQAIPFQQKNQRQFYYGDICILMFIAALLVIDKLLNQPRC
jgi:hypothetical protein